MEGADAFLKRFWEWRLRNFPEFATTIGYDLHDDKLDDMTLFEYARRRTQILELLSEARNLKSMQNTALTEEQELSLLLLTRELEQVVKGMDFKTYLCPVNQLEGPQVYFPRLLLFMKTDTFDGYDVLLKRLEQFPRQVDEIIALLTEGIKEKWVMSRISVEPVLDQISSLISKPLTETAFYLPFAVNSPKIDGTRWKEIKAKGTTLIETGIIPSYKKLASFLQSTYIPSARQEVAARFFPSGQEYYERCLEFHTDTSLKPHEIHNLGKQEVDRIKQRINDLRLTVGFQGSINEFVESVKTDPKFSFQSQSEILECYRNTCGKIKERLPALFNTLPRTDFEILPIRDDIAPNYPGAYYLAPPKGGSKPGVFYINTYMPERRKKYEVMSLALHEANPGHHHQGALAVEITDVPEFRRYLEDRNYYQAPGRFSMYTAFVEGWGLYAEYLGEEMGLYHDPYDMLGRLSNEMFRAVRLVVDTGIHVLGWSREDAITYISENTAMLKNEVVAEVDRYITMPGQACGYKIGELKLKELRKRAQEALGCMFDVREFHDMLMMSGLLPLDLLEEQVEKFIVNKCNTLDDKNNVI